MNFGKIFGYPIGVTPLYNPKSSTISTILPKLTYHGGPLLSKVSVVMVYWGNTWQKNPPTTPTQIDKFLDYICTSSLMTQLSEYSTSQIKIGPGRHASSVFIPNNFNLKLTSDRAIRQMLNSEIKNNVAFPKPNENTLYFIHLPPGVRVRKGLTASCSNFCGYHETIDGKIFYAVMPFPNCLGCLGNLSPFDALTSTSSHELCEAITDPVPGIGWYDSKNGEIGDICAWKTKKLGNYTVQLEWSNKNRSCI